MFRQTVCSKLFQNLETKLPLPLPRLGFFFKKIWVCSSLCYVLYLSLSATYLVCFMCCNLPRIMYIMYNITQPRQKKHTNICNTFEQSDNLLSLVQGPSIVVTCVIATSLLRLFQWFQQLLSMVKGEDSVQFNFFSSLEPMGRLNHDIRTQEMAWF